MSRFEKSIKIIQLVISVLGLIGIWLAWGSLSLSAKHAKHQYDQSRREFVMKLYDDWRDVLDRGSARRSLHWVLGAKDEEIIAVAKGEMLEDSDSDEIQQDLVALLNLFEKIAVAERDGIADKDMIKIYFSGTVSRYFDDLKRFREAWKQEHRGDWSEVAKVIKRWNEKPGGKGTIDPNS